MLNDSIGDAGDSAPSPGETAQLAVRRYNMRLGLTLFGGYLALYASFVLTSAFVPDAMDWRPLGGLNLALLWGFGLIVAAILLALVYGVCSRVAAAEEAA